MTNVVAPAGGVVTEKLAVLLVVIVSEITNVPAEFPVKRLAVACVEFITTTLDREGETPPETVKGFDPTSQFVPVPVNAIPVVLFTTYVVGDSVNDVTAKTPVYA